MLRVQFEASSWREKWESESSRSRPVGTLRRSRGRLEFEEDWAPTICEAPERSVAGSPSQLDEVRVVVDVDEDLDVRPLR